ncbi:hypothetical protein GTP55_13155 [Duganella sp. FT109W]|uniref:DUF3106 domain-containing protein n=1 Tax=Duganella margarita TaxID=2692170 RepID=A0ABW9WJ18_9BURK|nr:hypothetical protein [Duganella margarita]MYN40324.1 hypothetical protein [Duganella margarita]
MKLSPEMEKVRASVFPDLSADDYMALLERNRARFNALPPDEQRRIREQLDALEREDVSFHAEQRRKMAEIQAKNAIEKPEWQAKRGHADG